MTDYYKELNLDPSSSLLELEKNLTQLESTWKRREITNPEKATTMLACIIQARKVFASDSLRRQYDRDLSKSKEKPVERDLFQERKQLFDKWFDDAISYFNSRQFDLAKTAIDKAFSFYDSFSENDFFYSVIADIYRVNHSYTEAVNYINNAIVINRSEAHYYIIKAKTLSDKADFSRGYETGKDRDSAVDTLNYTISLAQNNRDKDSESEACGILAYIYYYHYPNKRNTAEELAQRSVNMGNVGGYASDILNNISRDRQREEEQRRQDEQLKKEQVERQAEYQRNQKIAEERHAEEQRKQAAREQFFHKCKAKFKMAFIACVIWWLCVIPFFVIEVKISKGRSGEDFLRDVIVMEVIFFISATIYSLYKEHGSLFEFGSFFTAFMCIGFFILWLFPVEFVGGWRYGASTNSVTIPSSIIFYSIMIVFKLLGKYAITPPPKP